MVLVSIMPNAATGLTCCECGRPAVMAVRFGDSAEHVCVECLTMAVVRLMDHRREVLEVAEQALQPAGAGGTPNPDLRPWRESV